LMRATHQRIGASVPLCTLPRMCWPRARRRLLGAWRALQHVAVPGAKLPDPAPDRASVEIDVPEQKHTSRGCGALAAGVAVCNGASRLKVAACVESRIGNTAVWECRVSVHFGHSAVPQTRKRTLLCIEKEIGDAPWNQEHTLEPRGVSVDSTCTRARLSVPFFVQDGPRIWGNRGAEAIASRMLEGSESSA
jgi:hypothetical protein